MESVKLSLRWLFSIDPSAGLVFLGVRSPDNFRATHDIRGPGEPFSLVDLGAIGQDVILDTQLQVTRDRRIKAKT